MAEINDALRFRPIWVGDPAVILESILQAVEGTQQQQAIGLYLEAVSGTLQANLTFVQGLRSLVAGTGQKK